MTDANRSVLPTEADAPGSELSALSNSSSFESGDESLESPQTLNNSDVNSVGKAATEKKLIPRNVINFPAQIGHSPRLPPLVATATELPPASEAAERLEVEAKEEAKGAPENDRASENDERKAGNRNGMTRTLSHLFQQRYLLFKLVCYSALVPASSKAVNAFFQGMDLYGNGTANFIFAVILTASVDLIAIDMLTRAAADLKIRWQWSALGLLLLSLAVIGLNIGLAFKNMSNDASLDARAKSEREWQVELTKKEVELSQANEAHAKAQGNYLATKWAGNPNPKACEEGAGNCRGPFVMRSVPLQSEVLAAEAKKSGAQASFEKAESEKPVDGAGISKGVLDLRIWFYSVLWGFIIMASIASPRRPT